MRFKHLIPNYYHHEINDTAIIEKTVWFSAGSLQHVDYVIVSNWSHI